MNAQEQALVEIAAFLEAEAIPYMVIGGMANAVWGVPRATLDVDVTVWVPDARIVETVRQIAASFQVLTQAPERFIAQTRVLPVQTREGVAIDIVFGMTPFEEEAIRRAVLVSVGDQAVCVCTAEDLILHKILSTRERDLEDVRGVIDQRRGQLDVSYLEPRIGELASLLQRPEIEELWRRWSRGSGGTA